MILINKFKNLIIKNSLITIIKIKIKIKIKIFLNLIINLL
jgi:hypothetical protein